MDANVYRSDIRDLIKDVESGRDSGEERLLEACDTLIKYGESHREKALVGFAHYSKGRICYATNNIAGFFMEMLAALKPLEESGEYVDYAVANLMLGRISICRNNIPDGLDYYEIALSTCENQALVDTEWRVNIRLGAVYLMVNNYEMARNHFTRALYYIEGHLDMPERNSWLAVAYIGIGETYLCMDENMQTLVYLTKIENECAGELINDTTIGFYSFAARSYAALNDMAKSREYIEKLDSLDMSKSIFLDIFDYVYRYLKFLIEKRDRIHFDKLIETFIRQADQTNMKYLKRKLLTLKIRNATEIGDETAKAAGAIEFFNLSEELSREDRIMRQQEIRRRQALKNMVEERNKVEKENRTLLKRSETDDLTGIYNRYKLNAYGDVAFERAVRTGAPVAVEILDIDFFSTYNDHYGRQEGDRCLRFVSEVIRKVANSYGAIFAARYGGAEFVLIYEGYSDKEVFKIAKELRSRIVGLKIENRYTPGKTKFVTVSQGIYWGVPEEGVKPWDFLHAADNVRFRLKEKTTGSILVGKAENPKTSAYVSEDGIETVDPVVRYHGNIEDEEE